MCECYKIGGPFIDVDPNCPVHGPGGLNEQMQEQANTIATLRAEVEKLRAALEEIETYVRHGGKSVQSVASIALAALAEEKPPLADLASRQVDLPPEDKSLLYGNLTKLYTETDNDR